jgi:hypothetical protein
MNIVQTLKHLWNTLFATNEISSLVRDFSYHLRYTPQAPLITLIASMMFFGLMETGHLFFIEGISPFDLNVMESDAMSRLPTPDSVVTQSFIFAVIALAFTVMVRSFKATFLVSFIVGSTIAIICHFGMNRSSSDTQLATYQQYAQHCPKLVDDMRKLQLKVEDYSFLRINNLNAYAAYHCPDASSVSNL